MIQVTEPQGPRFELALERLCSGHAFRFQDISFWLAPDGHLEVSVDSSWRIEHVTEQTALQDLKRGESVLVLLCRSSAEFADIVKVNPPRLVLINDYGSGAVELAHLQNHSLVWATGMPINVNGEAKGSLKTK